MKNDECRVIGSTFSCGVQGVLFALSFSTLILKRSLAHPKRPFATWVMDSSKQGLSSFTVHFINLATSAGMARHTSHIFSNVTEVESSGPSQDDECALYFVAFLLDTTLGIFVTYLFVRLTILLARRGLACKSWECPGYYGEEKADSYGRIKNWAEQCFQWFLVTVAMKGVMTAILWFWEDRIQAWGDRTFERIRVDSPKLELVLVMVVAPAVLNTVQFWLNDEILMSRSEGHNSYKKIVAYS